MQLRGRSGEGVEYGAPTEAAMETYDTILDEKSILVLSEDSELFKYLRK